MKQKVEELQTSYEHEKSERIANQKQCDDMRKRMTQAEDERDRYLMELLKIKSQQAAEMDEVNSMHQQVITMKKELERKTAELNEKTALLEQGFESIDNPFSQPDNHRMSASMVIPSKKTGMGLITQKKRSSIINDSAANLGVQRQDSHGSSNNMAAKMSSSRANIFDSAPGEVSYRFKAHEKGVTCMVWNPQGRAIATCGGDCLMKLWNIDSQD